MKIFITASIFNIIVWIYLLASWIINAVHFFQCDFEGPWKEEVIKGIGIVIFPLSGITVWF